MLNSSHGNHDKNNYEIYKGNKKSKIFTTKKKSNINEESNSGNGICVWFHMEYYPG